MTDNNPLAGLDRRELIKRTALLGATATSPALLAACATGGGGTTSDKPKTSGGKKTKENPFGVDPEAPLDVVIFKGGFSDEYAKAHEKMYSTKFPKAKVKHLGTREITGTQQTRFVNGNPPDVIDNSGAQSMDSVALITQGQMSVVDDLLNAPSLFDPAKKVRDTLITDALSPATVENKVYGIPYALNINGLWHDEALFQQNGWEMPKTWDELMTLGTKIKAKGIPPWIYQGQYPGYMTSVFYAMVQKHGGTEPLKAVDNLQEGAWESPAIKDVLDAFFELKQRDFIMKGTAGLTHILAQNAWAKGKAAIIPCGSWLKSEIGSQLPPTFEMAVTPTPSLDSSDKMPYESCPFSSGEVFYVPSKAKNISGGFEYLRIMLSKEGAQAFAKLTYTLSIVEGAHTDQELDSVLESSLKIIDTAKKSPRLDQIKVGAWYKEYGEYINEQMGQLLTGKLDPKGFVTNVSKRGDKVKNDPKIKKFTR